MALRSETLRSWKVVFASNYGGYRNIVTISHSEGIGSLYGHLSKISVTIGNGVMAGEIIGKVGATGNITGPHLHFEIRVGRVPIDPKGVWDWGSNDY